MWLRSLDRRVHIIVDPACSQKTARCATDQTLDWTGRISQARLVALSAKGVTAVFVGGAIVGAGAVALVDALTGSDSEPGLQAAKQASPDTPPAEFAYLDSGRVVAYLGQIEGGLAATQTRTRSEKRTAKASITANDIAAAEM